ncbi:MAG TPA: hypothetical protein PK765_00300 [bacterium]|nr:hypothetical protein [bacterium]
MRRNGDHLSDALPDRTVKPFPIPEMLSRFPAVARLFESEARRAAESLRAAGMSELGRMIPAWTADCFLRCGSYEEAERAYDRGRNQMNAIDPNDPRSKASFEQAVFQFGLSRKAC